MSLSHALAGLLTVLALVAPAAAQDSNAPADATKMLVRKVMSGQASDKETRKLMKILAETTIAAAHPSGKNPSLDGYAFQRPTQDTLVLTLSVTYYGVITQKQYYAQANFLFDVSDPKEVEIDKLEFTKGNNIIPPSQKNLAELKQQLNKLLAN